MLLKKILLCLTLISSAIMNHAMHAAEFNAEFNPEKHYFSKTEDIKKWIHPYFIDCIPQVQGIIGQAMLENLEALTKNNIIHIIKNNDGDTRFYGKTFPIIPLPLTCLLKSIKDLREQLQSTEEKLILIEVGGGSGLVPLLMAFAGGPNAIIIYNELSKYEIEKGKILFEQVSKEISLPMENIIFDAGDANGLPDRFPQYINSIAITHAQNVEHFLNPSEHQEFAKTLVKMTAPTGYIHLLAHTIPVGCGAKGNSFFDAYIKNKKDGKTYPMFLKTEQDLIQLGGKYLNNTIFIEDKNIANITVSSPKENDICISTGFVKSKIYKNYNGEQTECFILHQQNLLNLFTPTIYKTAYTKVSNEINSKIEQSLAGFIDNKGERLYSEFNNAKHLTYAFSIFYKAQ